MDTNRETQNVTLEDIENEGVNNAKMITKKIYDIWIEFGIDSNRKNDRARVVWNHVQNLLKEIYESEHSSYEDYYKEHIVEKTEGIKKLCSELEMTPNEHDCSLTVLQKEELLIKELDALTKIKEKRKTTYQELKRWEQKYCKDLNIQEHQLLSNTGVPSEKDISELDHHIKMLKDEKERRQRKFSLARKELATILEVTEYSPESSLERDILSGEDASLTNETFKVLEEVICKAQKRKAELEAKKKSLIEKLTALWLRLKVDESKRAQFLSKHADCRLSTIQSIEQEIERCEATKRANIGSFISKLRIELVQLWDKCYVSQVERDLFHNFFSTDLSDESLDAHEAEVKKWENHYVKVEHILKNIEKRKQLWDLMIVFENKANDPNRFKNRKGNLLKEEKERKKLQKDLPALENKIFNDIEELGVVDFLYYGEDFRSFVTKQWIERNNQKESEKAERHNKHLLQLGNKATIGTPLKRTLFMKSPKSCPSKLFKSSMPVPALRTPIANRSKAVPSTVAKMGMKTSKLFQSAQKPPKLEQNILKERNQKTCSKPPKAEKPETSKLNGTTYMTFASELDKTARYNLRSSVLATKNRGGTRISQTVLNRGKRRSAAKSLRKSLKNTSSNLTPARGKLGLPFLI